MLFVNSLMYSNVTSDLGSELDPYIEQVSTYGGAAPYIRKVTDGLDIELFDLTLEVTMQGESKQLDDEITMEGHTQEQLAAVLDKLSSGDYTIGEGRIVAICKDSKVNRKRLYVFQQVGI